MEAKKKNEKRELYNLESDPSEEKNVIGENQEVAARLEALLTKQIKEGRSNTGKPASNDTGWWSDLVWIDESNW